MLLGCVALRCNVSCLFVHVNFRVRSVGLSVSIGSECVLCKNGWSNWTPVLGGGLGWPKEQCIRHSPDPSWEETNFGGKQGYVFLYNSPAMQPLAKLLWDFLLSLVIIFLYRCYSLPVYSTCIHVGSSSMLVSFRFMGS